MELLTPIKTITVWQPWATLIALQLKLLETRGWATKHRGPLAIHAAQKIDREACEREPIKSALAKYGYTVDNLPTGSIVAIANLSECYQIERPTPEQIDGGPIWLKASAGGSKGWAGKFPDEYYFGDYSAGRFAWELTNVQQLKEPIPAKGQQGLWNWNHRHRLPAIGE
ncbi:ASCH domain-containing protein [Paenibacillus sp. GCM10012307]|uniref:ASCH domain-containing protein n=1 Tax=Paenibacillus TaxID=44249 RepID=UPI001E535916|nr:ASCH domain-containing protein [Paenibacillus roseus]